MGTAWPQKYHSSRGHASAAATTTTVLAQKNKNNKTALSPVVVVAPSLTPLTPLPRLDYDYGDFLAEDDWDSGTADAASATQHGFATTTTTKIAATAAAVPSVGPAGHSRGRRRRCRSVENDRNPAAVSPVTAGLWRQQQQLSAAHWRPTDAGEDVDDRGSIKASATAATTTTKTTTTMNASNHVTLNRFVRLTITLLITRNLMLRLVQLQTLLASAVVLLTATVNKRDNNNNKPLHQPQQKQQPNAAIQQPTNNNCTVKRRRSAPTTKTKGISLEQNQPQQRQPSDDCWPPSLYCYPVLPAELAPAVVAAAAIVKRVLTESVQVTAATVVRMTEAEAKAGDAAAEEKRMLRRRQREDQTELALECSEWCGSFCRHCSSLTCSRFFMENVTRRSCPGRADRPTEPSARRCSPTRRTTRASVCTSS